MLLLFLFNFSCLPFHLSLNFQDAVFKFGCNFRLLFLDAVLKGISDGLSRGKKPEEIENLVILSFKIDDFSIIDLISILT